MSMWRNTFFSSSLFRAALSSGAICKGDQLALEALSAFVWSSASEFFFSEFSFESLSSTLVCVCDECGDEIQNMLACVCSFFFNREFLLLLQCELCVLFCTRDGVCTVKEVVTWSLLSCQGDLWSQQFNPSTEHLLAIVHACVEWECEECVQRESEIQLHCVQDNWRQWSRSSNWQSIQNSGSIAAVDAQMWMKDECEDFGMQNAQLNTWNSTVYSFVRGKIRRNYHTQRIEQQKKQR